jgi:hypothetical protein
MTAETPIPGGVKVGGIGLRVLLRHYFSTPVVDGLPRKRKGTGDRDAHTGESTFDIEHRAYVLSPIASAAGFLEATINEFFQDAHDEHNLTGDGYLAPLSAETVQAMVATWRGTGEGSKLNALEKWQLMRIFAGSEPLDRGRAPYQDAQLVVQLRNAILHYRPESIGADEPHKMEERLRGRFAENRLMEGSGNAWWPSHCLGHACAEWAARSALAFAGQICGDLGINPNYQRIAGKGWHGKPRSVRAGSTRPRISDFSELDSDWADGSPFRFGRLGAGCRPSFSSKGLPAGCPLVCAFSRHRGLSPQVPPPSGRVSLPRPAVSGLCVFSLAYRPTPSARPQL